jgi:hypothetical protein
MDQHHGSCSNRSSRPWQSTTTGRRTKATYLIAALNELAAHILHSTHEIQSYLQSSYFNLYTFSGKYVTVKNLNQTISQIAWPLLTITAPLWHCRYSLVTADNAVHFGQYLFHGVIHYNKCPKLFIIIFFAEIAMLMTYHFVCDFGHIPHIILCNWRSIYFSYFWFCIIPLMFYVLFLSVTDLYFFYIHSSYIIFV